MQKRVCEHVIKSIHSEAERMKEDWKNKLGKQVKPDEQDKPPESDEAQGQSSPDTYCFELVSMVMGLCQSEVGRLFLAEQRELIRDLLTLLHVSTTRIQLQVKPSNMIGMVCIHVHVHRHTRLCPTSVLSECLFSCGGNVVGISDSQYEKIVNT